MDYGRVELIKVNIMKNKLVKIISILVALIAIVAVSFVVWKKDKNEEVIPVEENNVEQDLQVYQNTKYDYEIKCPKEWIIKDNSHDVSLFYSKKVDFENDGNDTGGPDLTIYAYSLSSEIEAKDFIEKEMPHSIFYENQKLGDNDVDIYRDAGYPDTYGSMFHYYTIQNGKNVYIISSLYKQQIFDILATFKSLK